MSTPTPATSHSLVQGLTARAALIAALPDDDVHAILAASGSDDAALRQMVGGLDALLFPVLARKRGLTADVTLDPDVWESALAHEAPLVIDRDTVEEWAGDFIPRERFDRLVAAIPHSSVPEALATITHSLIDDEV